MKSWKNVRFCNENELAKLELLNILFCAALLWFFSRNAFLRPFLGSTGKEALSGVMLLATLYANYYILYPKLYRGHVTVLAFGGYSLFCNRRC
jgi:hypothetical protein